MVDTRRSITMVKPVSVYYIKIYELFLERDQRSAKLIGISSSTSERGKRKKLKNER